MADYLLTGINPDLRRRVKSVLAAEGRTIKDFLLECLEKKADDGDNFLTKFATRPDGRKGGE